MRGGWKRATSLGVHADQSMEVDAMDIDKGLIGFFCFRMAVSIIIVLSIFYRAATSPSPFVLIHFSSFHHFSHRFHGPNKNNQCRNG
jgi:hypothetical protein